MTMARKMAFAIFGLLAPSSLSFADCALDAYNKACASCSFDSSGKIDASCQQGYQASGTACVTHPQG